MKGLEMTFVKLQVENITLKMLNFLQIHMKGLEMTFVKLKVENIALKMLNFFTN